MQETHVSSGKLQSNWEHRVSFTMFPLENWVSFSKEYSLYAIVFLWEKHSFVGKWSQSCWMEETYVSAGIIAWMLEAWECFTMISFKTKCEGPKNTIYIQHFQGGKCPVFYKKSVLLKVRDLCISWNNTIKVGTYSVLHITCHWELSMVVKSIFLVSHHFLVGESFTLSKRKLNADF
jgi:hypothetical protein